MSPVILKEFIDDIVTRFAFHLYDTHGVPREMLITQLESMNFEEVFKHIVQKHKDFLANEKEYYENNKTYHNY